MDIMFWEDMWVRDDVEQQSTRRINKKERDIIGEKERRERERW